MKILALLTITVSFLALGGCATCQKSAANCCGASGSMKCDPAKPKCAMKTKNS